MVHAMTRSLVFTLWLRRLARVLTVLVALAAAGFAATAALMYVWVLPNIAEHRETVANLMSRALGQRVTLEAVSGDWHQARPTFDLSGVRLYDSQGRQALVLPAFSATFSWRSLLFLEPRFSRIDLDGLALDVRRTRDGRYYVGGIPVDPAASESRFSNWLLRQGTVRVRAATLTWLDEARAVPPVEFEAVSLTLENALRRHRLQLSATPPADLGRPLTLDARWTARHADEIDSWRGRVDLRTPGVAFAPLIPLLAAPYLPTQGWGALHLGFAFDEGALTVLDAGFNLRGIETRLDAALPPLRLAQALGQMRWRRAAAGQRVEFSDVRLAYPGGALGAPFGFGYAWDARAREVTASRFDLGHGRMLLPSVPIDAALRARLQRMNLSGRLDTFRLAWSGVRPALDNFTVDTRFTRVSAAAHDATPGVETLSGRIEGNAAAGRFAVDASPTAFDLPQLFREPVVGLDRLKAKGRWKKTARGHLLALDAAEFANRDAAGTAHGRYELITGKPGSIDLKLQLTRADGSAVHRYVPKKIGDRTVNWLRDGIVAGHSRDVRLTLRGDMTRFPFEHGGGVFEVDAPVEAVTLIYAPGWPRIENIDARVVFRGKAMEITTTRAQLYGVALAPVRAVIPDLIHHEEQLHIEGEANGQLADFIRFANFSPVADRLHGFTDTLNGAGLAKLALKLHIPLRHSHDTTVAGRLSFQNATLIPDGLPRVDQVRGAIDFTRDSVSTRGITAQFLGGPLVVDTQTRGDMVKIVARGRATAAGMAPWLGAPWNRHLSGQAAWRGQADLLATGARVRVESDLQGLASRLPAPLAKPAEQTMALTMTSQPRDGGQVQTLQLGEAGGAAWQRGADGRFTRGEIHFGGAAELPAEPGLRLAGSGRGLDFSGWLAMLPDGDAPHGMPLTAINLGFDSLDWMGRRYHAVKLQGRVRNGLFRTSVSGDGVSGALTYRPAGAQPARVSAQFSQLTIPEREAGGGATAALDVKGADFPIVDLSVDDFRLQSRPMGRLEVVARGAPEGLVIDKLRLQHADSLFRMTGLWRDGGNTETQAELSLSVSDAGRFLARFGYPDTLKRGRADIQGSASWAGSPADFAFSTLAGELVFKAREGQFLKVEPGVGKLLGVLSLQSLPRRLNLDFRDIFNEGFAFDEIGATLRVSRGVVYSDDFRMRGPSAKVNMSGLADINQESVQLRLKVIPKLSESVAVAGALIGGPLAGLGALAAQKILRDPLEEAVSQEYLVTGPWLAPEVNRLAKIRGKADPAANEP